MRGMFYRERNSQKRSIKSYMAQRREWAGASSSPGMPLCQLWRGLLLLLLIGVPAAAGMSRGRFGVISGSLRNVAIPRDFYLEGNAIPVEKRNAVLIQTPAGKRAVFALLVTQGFASRIQQKYLGMLITEGDLTLCGKNIKMGSYGFGLSQVASEVSTHAHFFLYNQAGEQVTDCDLERDSQLAEPRPLQVTIEPEQSARLYLGRYWLELGP